MKLMVDRSEFGTSLFGLLSLFGTSLFLVRGKNLNLGVVCELFELVFGNEQWSSELNLKESLRGNTKHVN